MSVILRRSIPVRAVVIAESLYDVNNCLPTKETLEYPKGNFRSWKCRIYTSLLRGYFTFPATFSDCCNKCKNVFISYTKCKNVFISNMCISLLLVNHYVYSCWQVQQFIFTTVPKCCAALKVNILLMYVTCPVYCVITYAPKVNHAFVSKFIIIFLSFIKMKI